MKRIIGLVSIVLILILLVGCVTSNGNRQDNKENNGTGNVSNGNQNQNDELENNPENNLDTSDETDKDDETQESPSTDQLDIEDYFPIVENTRYIYEGKGNEYASYDVYIDYTTEEKVQQRVSSGGTVLARVIKIDDGKLTRVYSKEEVYYRQNLLEAEGKEEEVLLMEPLKEGTEWTLRDSRVRKITGTSVEVTTPSGNYKAIEVLTEGPESKTYDYYAKDVGLVKSVFVSGDTEVSSSLSKIEKDTALVQKINFYYPSIEPDKYFYEAKSISFKTNDITRHVLEKAYKEMPKGNVSKVFSENTKINSLYLNKDGMVYIDLNKAFIDEMNAGASYEAMILQSVANTFGQYYNAERVILTIDNELYESGHIALDKGEYLKVKLDGASQLK